MSTNVIVEPILPAPEHLELQVQRRVGSRVRNLHIQMRPNGLVLQGWAATYHAKQLAQHIAMELAPLPILANDIEVR